MEKVTKKLSFYFACLAVLLQISSCKNENFDMQPQGMSKILAFSVNGTPAEINEEKGEVVVYVSAGTNLQELNVELTLSTGSSISPDLKTGLYDFTSAKNFEVISFDKKSTKSYSISVLYKQNTIKEFYIEHNGNKYNATIDDAAGTVMVNIPKALTDVSKLKPVINLYENAKVIPLSSTELDLSGGKEGIYVVTYNGFKKTYRVWAQYIEVQIKQFNVMVNGKSYKGSINQQNKTIRINVPFTVNLSSLKPEITYTANSTLSPASGISQNFKSPIIYTVTNIEGVNSYTVTVSNQPIVGFLSIYPNPGAITNADEKKAYSWFENTYPNGQFLSFNEINNGADLELFKVLWWHNDEFANLPQSAINAVGKLKEFNAKGNGLLLTTFANRYVGLLGISKDGKSPNVFSQSQAPNQYVWGSGLSINGNLTHPIFKNDLTIFNFGDGIDRVYLIFDNTWRSEKQAIWTLGAGAPYADANDWRLKTGGIDFASAEWDGSRNAMIQMAEFPKNNKGNGEGAVISIGAPAYDWKVDKEGQAGYVPNSPTFQSNIEKITSNSIKYLLTQ